MSEKVKAFQEAIEKVKEMPPAPSPPPAPPPSDSGRPDPQRGYDGR